MLEKQIEKKVGEYVKEKGGLFYKFTSPGRRGVPDRLVIMPDSPPFFIEFKAEGGKTSVRQDREIERIRKRNADVYVVDNVEDGKEIIDLYLC